MTADDLRQSGHSIAALQLPSGMIEWFPGGHADPWNHVETAMALTTVGMMSEAERESARARFGDSPEADNLLVDFLRLVFA